MTAKKTILVAAVTGLAVITAGSVLAQRDGGPRERLHAAHGEQGQRGEMRGQRGARMQARMMDMIEQYDTNGDGQVSQEEIDTVRAARLSEFDADGDGALSLEEYEALWLDAMRERMVDRFQAHDDDGDGAVTIEEFGEEFSNMVPRFDRNGDGVVSEDDLSRRRANADAE